MALSYARYSKMFSLIQEGLTFFPHTSNNFTIIPHSSPLIITENHHGRKGVYQQLSPGQVDNLWITLNRHVKT